MLLKIEQAGHVVLRKPARKVSTAQLQSAAFQQLIDLMVATLRDKPGVGLAAPQVGESVQMVIIEDKRSYQQKLSPEVLAAQKRRPVPLKVLINPRYEVIDGEQAYFFEGCLSVEGYRAVVPRAAKVKVSALDRIGKAVTFTADGWLARIVQHEIDHLHGSLYIDSMYPKSLVTERCFQSEWADALPDAIRLLIK